MQIITEEAAQCLSDDFVELVDWLVTVTRSYIHVSFVV